MDIQYLWLFCMFVSSLFIYIHELYISQFEYVHDLFPPLYNS